MRGLSSPGALPAVCSATAAHTQRAHLTMPGRPATCRRAREGVGGPAADAHGLCDPAGAGRSLWLWWARQGQGRQGSQTWVSVLCLEVAQETCPGRASAPSATQGHARQGAGHPPGATHTSRQAGTRVPCAANASSGWAPSPALALLPGSRRLAASRYARSAGACRRSIGTHGQAAARTCVRAGRGASAQAGAAQPPLLRSCTHAAAGRASHLSRAEE
jgi:hypothetical protein